MEPRAFAEVAGRELVAGPKRGQLFAEEMKEEGPDILAALPERGETDLVAVETIEKRFREEWLSREAARVRQGKCPPVTVNNRFGSCAAS